MKHWQSVAIVVLGAWSVGVTAWCLELHDRQTGAASNLEQFRAEIERMHYNQRSTANFADGLVTSHAIRGDSLFRPLAFRHRPGDRKLWDDPDKWTPDLFPFMMDDYGNPVTIAPDGTIRTHHRRGEQ